MPIGYPVACSPQAWAAASLPFMLSQVLGLYPTDGGRVLQVARPVLPACLNEVRLRGLRVGDSRLDLYFTRGDDPHAPARLKLERQTGSVEVRALDVAPPI